MKKTVLSLALALLMLVGLCPRAAADITYTSPGDVELGTPFRYLLATVSAGSTVSASGGTLPPGCSVSTEQGDAGLNIYLGGTPSALGRYDCLVDIGNGNSLLCPINVVMPSLSLGTSSDLVCYPRATAELSVTAGEIPGAVLSYQWYVSNTPDGGGDLIPFATNPRYLADTSYIGTKYYYCIVTASLGNQNHATVSRRIRVQVEELQVASIAVDSLPAKLEYLVGETLDTTGLRLLVTMAGGETRLLEQDFGVFPSQLDTVGEQEIQLSYMGQSCSFTVKVLPEEELVESIAIKTPPRKLRYEQGEALNTEGLKLLVTTDRAEHEVDRGFTCVPNTLNLVGEQSVTVRYEGKSCTFTVTVTEPAVPVRIDVASRAGKLDYTVGDTLDTSGLVLRLVDSNGGSKEIRSGFVCEPSLLNTAGRQKITVSYQDFQCSYYVTVAPASPQATQLPRPSGSVSPTPVPTTAPDRSEHKPYDTGLDSGILMVIIIASLLVMAGLGAYVFVMQQGGIQNLLRRFRRK